MKPLGPWAKEALPPPGTRVWARYSEHDKGYTGTALGAVNEGGYNSTEVCLDCILEATRIYAGSP